MATNTGFIDLMSFARGQELGNQMNWRDVINDINTRQSEQNLQMQQEQWAMAQPLQQERTQSALDAMQANREGAAWQAGVFQQSAALPAEQRTDFMLGEYNRRLRTLDPNTPAGAAQIRNAASVLTQQGYAALRAGDEVGARKILEQVATMYSPLDAQAQQRAKQTQYFEFLNQQAPGMFVQNPVTGAPVNMSELLIAQERLRQLGALPGNTVPAAQSMAPGETIVAPGAPVQPPGPTLQSMAAAQPAAPMPAPQLQPTAAAPYANVRWTDVINPWSIPNTQLRTDMTNWMPQWLTAPAPQPQRAVPFGSFNVFGGGFR